MTSNLQAHSTIAEELKRADPDFQGTPMRAIITTAIIEAIDPQIGAALLSKHSLRRLGLLSGQHESERSLIGVRRDARLATDPLPCVITDYYITGFYCFLEI